MREGPLAALFQRTDQPDPATAEAAEATPEPVAPALEAPEVAPEVRAAPQVHEVKVEARQADPPEPAERLATVFSNDLPVDMMQGPGRRGGPATPADGVRRPVLRVVGVGGAGVNALNRMVEAGVGGVEFIAVNTDQQSLQQSAANVTLHIGSESTRGLGSGADPSLGREAAYEDWDRLKALLKGSDMVFVTAGAGGGTGTGAAPVIAEIAREVGAVTVGIVTKPFGFEGARRMSQAEQGVAELAHEVDTLIVVPNDRLLSVLDRSTSMVEAFRVADDVLRQGVQGISDLVTLPGLINLDFADVRTVMTQQTQALLGIGMGTGERRALDAAEQAVTSPLLDTSVEGARAILLSITGGPDLSLFEVNEAAETIAEAAHPDANIIFGAMIDEDLGDQVWVTVVATGYGDQPAERPSVPSAEHAGHGYRNGNGNGRPQRAPVAGLEIDESRDIPEFVPRA